MRKSLLLKLVALAILGYVAILPLNTAKALCDKSECLLADPRPGQDYGDITCAYYDTGYTNYANQCFVEGSEVPPGSGNWVNACKHESC
jgi:hypothetical protein